MKRIQCPNCGGFNNIEDDATNYVCDYCNSPNNLGIVALNKKVQTFLDRGNAFRIRNDFNDAKENYKRVITEDPNNAEAYWGLTLCDYWVEYVDDPKTGKKIPTCHRTIKEPILESINLKHALSNADVITREYYQNQANEISELQKKILRVIASEEPYDVFISYKETDKDGNRTNESREAVKIYNMLRKEGYKVFYARETLKGKLGVDYEPYIYSALTTAKLMLVIGTNKENMESVWVKNEWSRYLDLMEDDYDKHLIPCYADMDPYDIPAELAGIQASNLRDTAFIDDLKITLEKIFKKEEPQEVKYVNNVIYNQNDTDQKVTPLLQSKLARIQDLLAYKRKDKYEEAREVVSDLLLEYPHNYEVNKYALIIDYGCYDIDEVFELVKNSSYPNSKGNPTNSVNFKNMFNNAPSEEIKKKLAMVDACGIMERAKEEVEKTWDYKSYFKTLDDKEKQYGELVDLTSYKDENDICGEYFTRWLFGVKNEMKDAETLVKNLLASLETVQSRFPENYILKYPAFLEQKGIADHNFAKYVKNYDVAHTTFDVDNEYGLLKEAWFYMFVQFITNQFVSANEIVDKALYLSLVEDFEAFRNIFYSINFNSQEEFDKFFEPLEELIPGLIHYEQTAFFYQYLDVENIYGLLINIKKINKDYEYKNLAYYYNFACKHKDVFIRLGNLAPEIILANVVKYLLGYYDLENLKELVKPLKEELNITDISSTTTNTIVDIIAKRISGDSYLIINSKDVYTYLDYGDNENVNKVCDLLDYVRENFVKSDINFTKVCDAVLEKISNKFEYKNVKDSYDASHAFNIIIDKLENHITEESYDNIKNIMSDTYALNVFTEESYINAYEKDTGRNCDVIVNDTNYFWANNYIDFLSADSQTTIEQITVILEHYKKLFNEKDFVDKVLYENAELLQDQLELDIINLLDKNILSKLKKGRHMREKYDKEQKNIKDYNLGKSFKGKCKMYLPIIGTWFSRIVLGLGLAGAVGYLCYLLYNYYF